MSARPLLWLLPLLAACGTEPSSPSGDPTAQGPEGSSASPGASARDRAPVPVPQLQSLPAGSFTMGSPADEVGRYPDETPHRVTLTRALLIGPTTVTQEQFVDLMGYEPTLLPGDDLPVTSITWHEAAAYTVALSQQEGMQPCYRCEGQGARVRCAVSTPPTQCTGYRLPTEAEWEFAARGGLEGQAFPNGGGLKPEDSLDCFGSITLDDGSKLDAIAWHCGIGGGVKPGAMLAPNGYGLYDMAGNIWEWCHDWHAPYAGDAEDPAGPDSGQERVVRGGSAKLYYPLHLRVAFRLAVEPDTRAPQIGFRLVRSPVQAPGSGPP
jgi:sulfatase modifying factor 1